MIFQPTLENSLVRIRPIKSEDLEPLFEVAKDPLIWEQHHVKRNQRSVFEQFFKESMDSGGGLIIVEKSTGEIIGSSRFQLINGFPEGIEIGWTFLARQFWGGRYNKSIKQIMIKHVFQYVDHVVLYINKKNLRSQKAAMKIGGKRLTQSQWKNIPRKDQQTLTFLISKQNSNQIVD